MQVKGVVILPEECPDRKAQPGSACREHGERKPSPGFGAKKIARRERVAAQVFRGGHPPFAGWLELLNLDYASFLRVNFPGHHKKCVGKRRIGEDRSRPDPGVITNWELDSLVDDYSLGFLGLGIVKGLRR